MVDHGLPDEDGADPRPRSSGGRRIRVVRGPAASNLDEWWPLLELSDLAWATAPGDLAGAELVVVPGSKLVAADLAWMRATTTFGPVKQVRRRTATFAATLDGPWRGLAGRRVDGYEIRFGTTAFGPPAVPALPDGLGFTCGNVLAVYRHGLAEDPDVAEALTGRRPVRALDRVFSDLADLADLADLVDRSIVMDRLLDGLLA